MVCKRVCTRKRRVRRRRTSAAHENREDRPCSKGRYEDGWKKAGEETQREEKQSIGREPGTSLCKRCERTHF
jgi:hypothetical protein